MPCALRCYAARRSWSAGDFIRVLANGFDPDYLKALWNGTAHQLSYEYLLRMLARLRAPLSALDPQLDEDLSRFDRPLVEDWEADELTGALKAELVPVAEWEHKLAQSAQVSESPGGLLNHVTGATRAMRARFRRLGRRTWRLFGPDAGSAGEGGFEPPIT